LFQIKRCSAPCTGEISRDDYAELVREAKTFLSGKSRAVKGRLAKEMDRAAEALDFERAPPLRDRSPRCRRYRRARASTPAASRRPTSSPSTRDGGFNCIEVFFFRTGQNWGNRAYFPRADRTLAPEEVLGAFLAQFYDDKPCPRLILMSHQTEDCKLLAEALSIKSGHKVEISVPQRGEKRDLIEHALANAREALGRKLAEAASQQRLLTALASSFGLAQPPRRIEVYDNSHIQGTNAVGAMIVAGPDGFRKNQYRKFNIRSTDLTPGDDFAMMREVLGRRFKRLLAEAPRACPFRRSKLRTLEWPVATGQRRERMQEGTPQEGAAERPPPGTERLRHGRRHRRPDLVLIDGGAGSSMQHAKRWRLGITDIAMAAVAKGPTATPAARPSIPGRRRSPPRPCSPGRAAARRAIASPSVHSVAARRHPQTGCRIAGIGPTRKRALRHSAPSRRSNGPRSPCRGSRRQRRTARRIAAFHDLRANERFVEDDGKIPCHRGCRRAGARLLVSWMQRLHILSGDGRILLPDGRIAPPIVAPPCTGGIPQGGCGCAGWRWRSSSPPPLPFSTATSPAASASSRASAACSTPSPTSCWWHPAC
jgi:excinuclease ABC subunit C